MDLSIVNNRNRIYRGHSLLFILFAFTLHMVAYSSFFGLSFVMDGFGNYSLWFPAAGFRFALIFILGWRYGLLIALAEIAAQGIIGDWATWDYHPLYIFFGSGSPSFICALVIWALERFKLTSPKLENFSQLIWFVAALVITPLLAAPVAAGIKVMGGRVPLADLPNSIMSYWIGDMIGMLMFAPIVLFGYRAYLRRSWRELQPLVRPAFMMEYLAAVIFIWLTVQYAGAGPLSLSWIPFFIPVVGISLRHGLPAASLIVLALNIMVVGLGSEISVTQLFIHQGFLALISALGLVLGGITSVRTRENAQMLRQYQMLTQIDRRNTMSEMSAEIIHEITQPLSATSLYAGAAVQMLEQGMLDKESLLETMNRMANETARTLELVRRMQIFARKGELNREESTTQDIIQAISHMIDLSAKKGNVTVGYDLPENPLPLTVDVIQVQQAILNLTRNSIEAMESCEIRELTISARQEQDGFIHISVHDTGPGMPESLEPYTSTKATGMGIGLKVVEAIMLAHEGRIERGKNTTSLIFKA